MYVKDVMVENVSTCHEDDNLAQVAGMMWNHACGVLPVLDSDGYIATMITDRDICIALGTRNARASEVRVKDVALPRVFTCGPEDDVSQALETMASQNVRRLPVVREDGTLAGILSIYDLLQRAELLPGAGGISYHHVISAIRSILDDRKPGHTQAPAELAAIW